MSRTEKAVRLAMVKIDYHFTCMILDGEFHTPSSNVDLYFLCRICSKECGGRAYLPINGLEKVSGSQNMHHFSGDQQTAAMHRQIGTEHMSKL